ncbi:hypothetical protein [Microbacterium sp.]
MSHQRGVIERTPENTLLVERVTGPADLTPSRINRVILDDDGSCRRVNGRYLIGNVLVPDENGRPQQRRGPDGEMWLVTRRHRFRIPRNHPWRGKRPTR